MFLELALKILLNKIGRSKRGPEDVYPIGLGPHGSLMGGIEGVVELYGVGQSTVRDVMKGENVLVLAAGVGVKVGDPCGSGRRLDIDPIFGGLGRKSCLGHGKGGEFVHNLSEDRRRSADLDVVRDG